MKFTEEHEWLRVEDDLVVVGITEHASTQLGDVVFVELPEELTNRLFPGSADACIHMQVDLAPAALDYCFTNWTFHSLLSEQTLCPYGRAAFEICAATGRGRVFSE